jgi:predicted RNase H-like HicB family nuclease
MGKYTYPAIFDYSDDRGVSVSFVDFQGCLTCGDNMDEALINAKEALAFHLSSIIKDNEYIPLASNVFDICLDQDQAVLLVSIFI